MTLLAESYIHTIEQPNLAAVRQLAANGTAPWPRRPEASGENPIYVAPTFVPEPQPGAETERITIPVLYGTPVEPEEPRRPWFYVGFHRWTRSRGLLFAATWPGGAR
ncbi:hypothetical protein Ait01nite_089880 [Actinoplanes italicus]|uniref:Uncharacterized protein n=1 Tax=Actinoplanes italicus TaxID=113567 RepID=A0A2T0JIH5_9ACTN|nr:hypothetical protein [Actinoplanes italicus]PRX07405.1 hypothetical protein CLV67_14280 [Actinoplanes italicus]GIE35943.1 hypothetical protein Ait01nite_089880 [Actinoplanes italicus]